MAYLSGSKREPDSNLHLPRCIGAVWLEEARRSEKVGRILFLADLRAVGHELTSSIDKPVLSKMYSPPNCEGKKLARYSIIMSPPILHDCRRCSKFIRELHRRRDRHWNPR